MAAVPNKTNTPKKTINPLLSGADVGFPFENLCASAMLMPIAVEENITSKEDVPTPTEPVPQDLSSPPSTTTPTHKPLFTRFKEAMTVEKMLDPFSRISDPSPDTTTVPPNTPAAYFNSSQSHPQTSSVHPNPTPSSYGNINFSELTPPPPPPSNVIPNMHIQNNPASLQTTPNPSPALYFNPGDNINHQNSPSVEHVPLPPLPTSYFNPNENINNQNNPTPVYSVEDIPLPPPPTTYFNPNEYVNHQNSPAPPPTAYFNSKENMNNQNIPAPPPANTNLPPTSFFSPNENINCTNSSAIENISLPPPPTSYFNPNQNINHQNSPTPPSMHPNVQHNSHFNPYQNVKRVTSPAFPSTHPNAQLNSYFNPNQNIKQETSPVQLYSSENVPLPPPPLTYPSETLNHQNSSASLETNHTPPPPLYFNPNDNMTQPPTSNQSITESVMNSNNTTPVPMYSPNNKPNIFTPQVNPNNNLEGSTEPSYPTETNISNNLNKEPSSEMLPSTLNSGTENVPQNIASNYFAPQNETASEVSQNTPTFFTSQSNASTFFDSPNMNQDIKVKNEAASFFNSQQESCESHNTNIYNSLPLTSTKESSPVRSKAPQINPYITPNIFNPNQTIPVSIYSSTPLSSTHEAMPQGYVQSNIPQGYIQPNIFNPNQTIPVSIFDSAQDIPYTPQPASKIFTHPVSQPMSNQAAQLHYPPHVQQHVFNPITAPPVTTFNPNLGNVPQTTTNLYSGNQGTPISLYNPINSNQITPVQPKALYPSQSNTSQTSGVETSVHKIQNLFSSNVSLYDSFPQVSTPNPEPQQQIQEPQTSEIHSSFTENQPQYTEFQQQSSETTQVHHTAEIADQMLAQLSQDTKTESSFMPYFTPISDSRPQSQTSYQNSRPPSVNSTNTSTYVFESKSSRPNSVNSINSNISNSLPPNVGTITEQLNAASFFDSAPQSPQNPTPNSESQPPVQLFNANMFRQPQKLKTPKYANPNCYQSVKTNLNPQDSFLPAISDPSVRLFDPNTFNEPLSESAPHSNNAPPLAQSFSNPNPMVFNPNNAPPLTNTYTNSPPPQFSTSINDVSESRPISRSPASYFTSKPLESTPKFPASIPTPPILEEATFINQNSSSIFGPIDTPFTQSTSQIPLFNPNVPSEIPLFNPNSIQEHQILNQIPQPVPLFSASEKSSSPEPASIPVSVSQINPKLSQHVLNPYSKSTAGAQQHASVAVTNPETVTAPPPPKSTMSGGNTYRLGGNSRPTYAPPPGLGQSVSAIASLAASMAMSTPMPVPGSHYDPQPLPLVPSAMPSIVASAPGVSSAAELFTPSSIPADFNSATYRPVYQHWFYKRNIEGREVWMPFSMKDSLELEKVLASGEKDKIVATDGGRYDVDVTQRRREPVYWSQPANEVRRCSWFYRGALDSRSTPYEETFAERLEEEYRNAFLSNYWPHRVEMSYGEAIIMNGPVNMVHIPPTSGSILEDWGTIQEQGTKPRTVRRGCDEFDIDEGEPGKPDHLLFLVHGIGSACDLKFRSVVEVVDDFRSMALTLVRSHFRAAGDEGRVNRVEVLPVSWHSALHGEETGIDKQLQGITLKSIPKLRHFTNDTLLDILFYTSPVYCQTIIRQVGHELNRLQQVFLKRNPDFDGGISLGGHSLGSLILFDLLCHQKPPPGHKKSMQDPLMFEEEGDDDLGDEPVPPPRHLRRRESCRVDYMVGPAGTGQPSITYPQLHFSPMTFFALGSPIAMFVTVRGIESLGQDFCLPTCPGFFNIFHPFDPVAYRVESLISTELNQLRPVVVPHHKGRKRMHIELRETMARVGTDLKERLVDSVKSTWNSVYQLAMFNRGEALEAEVDKVLAQQMLAQDAAMQEETLIESDVEADPQLLGKLNAGRRVDYVLQEAPLESFNEYLFALGSHVCYWESEDTMLMMLKEIYSMLGVPPDRQFDRSRESSMVRDVPRDRSWSGGSKGSSSPSQYFINQNRPTPPGTPPNLSPLSPPPMSGFVRKQ